MTSFIPQLVFEDLGSQRKLPSDRPAGFARIPTWLTADEAAFIESAFELILPELNGESEPRVDAAAFVEDQLHSQGSCTVLPVRSATAVDITVSPAQIAESYRLGIAAIQRKCLLEHNARFQDLPTPVQHMMLEALEEGSLRAETPACPHLFELMVYHAAQVYFEATQVALRRRRRAGLGASPANGDKTRALDTA